jgi:tight adherence protein B
MTGGWAAVVAIVSTACATSLLVASGDAVARVRWLASGRQRRSSRLGRGSIPTVAGSASRLVSRARAARAPGRVAAQRRAAVVQLCLALVPELQAGRNPREALARVAPAGIVAGQAVVPASFAMIEDVPAALRAAAAQPGAEALTSVAACWQVAQRHGGGLAPALRRLADSLRADEALRREIAAQLAGARATARLLAALPALGVLLGTGLGGRPVEVLLHTPYGLACLVIGVTLQVAGLCWTNRIAKAAERRA